MLCSRSLLVFSFICSSIYMLIPNSWFISPLPFPFGNISLFFVSVDLFLFCIYVRLDLLFLRFRIKAISYDIFLSLCGLLHLVWLSLIDLHPCCCKWHYFIPFLCLTSIPLCVCMCVPNLLYPFICWCTLRLLPCLGSCKECCDERWCAWNFRII